MELDRLNDTEIVTALLRRDPRITRQYFYVKCFPLFKSVFSRYNTDCTDVVEFINEMYLFVMQPAGEEKKSRLSRFAFRCSLTMWLKIVAENYCKSQYAKRLETAELIFDPGDRNEDIEESLDINCREINAADVGRLLDMMPNARYRRIIELRYLQELSNEETAQQLQMTMENFYNKHRLAKRQFEEMLKKEGIL